MAINFINKDDLTHICRTTKQWETTVDRYEIIPSGVLCIELCNDKLTKIKIGNGHLIYEKLPYVSDVDLTNYYTKEETDNIIKNLKSIKIKGEASRLSDLPLRGNEEGDLWFVKKTSPDENNKYDEYVWYKNNWESWGSSDIDLSEYAKIEYVDSNIQEVNDRITEIIESGYLHKHNNKQILDQITAPFTTEKDNKLRDLHNYDDTELRNKAHTHSNKSILDQTDAIFNRDKDEKLASLENYDDTAVQNRLHSLERVAHFHENKQILDETTAPFTREQAIQLVDCKDFEGTDGTNDGYHGFVPAPTAADVGKVLGANGQWVASNASLEEGDAISIEDNPNTGGKVVSVRYNDGLKINQNNELEANIGDGLTVNQDNEIEASIGDGLLFDENDSIAVDPDILPPTYFPGTAIVFEDTSKIDITIDSWGNGTNWGNWEYYDDTSPSYISWNENLMKVPSTDNLFEVPAGVTQAKCSAISDDGTTQLSTRLYFYNSSATHFATSAGSTDPDTIINIPTGTVYINQSIRNPSGSGNIYTNNVSAATITWIDATPSPEVTINVWNGGTGWANGAYTAATGDSFIPWAAEVHSDRTNSWEIPEGVTKVKVEARSNDNTLLHPTMHWLTSQGGGRFGYGCPIGTDPYDSWIDIPVNAVYTNIGLRWQQGSGTGISTSDIKSVKLTWYGALPVTGNLINVNYGDGLTVNQDNQLKANLGDGLTIDSNNAITIDDENTTLFLYCVVDETI